MADQVPMFDEKAILVALVQSREKSIAKLKAEVEGLRAMLAQAKSPALHKTLNTQLTVKSSRLVQLQAELGAAGAELLRLEAPGLVKPAPAPRK